MFKMWLVSWYPLGVGTGVIYPLFGGCCVCETAMWRTVMCSGGRFLKSGGGTRFPLDVPEALIRFDDGDVNLAQRQLARHLRRRGRGRMVIREQLVMSWGVLVQARGEENTTSDHTICKVVHNFQCQAP